MSPIGTPAPSAPPQRSAPLTQDAPAAPAPEAVDDGAAAAAPADSVKLSYAVDRTGPHPRIIIPSDNGSINARPVTGSKTARTMVSGGVVGAMSGGFIGLQFLAASPVAAAAVAVGSAVVGAVMGYLATHDGKHDKHEKRA